MDKTCFVIMGFGIKNNINLDLAYEKIIKPCIIENKLLPFPLYQESKYNAFRCDEISGLSSIDYKFVTCLNGADIVIADISTMNVNAIYELGARHALKPRSTILLCSKDKNKDFKFFDLTYVPIIFYDHEGQSISEESIAIAKTKLNEFLDFAINSTSIIPDNPIQRALNETCNYNIMPNNNECSIYQQYKDGRHELDCNNYEKAEEILQQLFDTSPSEENLLLLVLAKYKKAEIEHSCKGLIDCVNLIKENIAIEDSTSEFLFGRLASICLRIYQINNENEFYHLSLEYYRKGANFCKKNLYCPRNYCAMLLRIYEITKDINIIKEYYYTAKHYAKLYLDMDVSVKKHATYEEYIYYCYNINDLKSIIKGEYIDYEKSIQSIQDDKDITARQRTTIIDGITQLKNDLIKINSILKPSLI